LSFGIAFGVIASQSMLRMAGIPPLISIDLSQGSHDLNWLIHPLLLIPLALLPALIFDFAYYWCHRLQHAVPFLWRLHAVHHAIEELNGTNCYHHWSEGLIRPIFMLIPLALLIQLKVPEVMAISILTGSWGQFVHLKAKLSFGPLDRLFVSPAFHRVHHSRNALHYDKNFAGVFSILDIVFGTAHFPTKDEGRIDTGLNDKLEAATLGQYFIALHNR
jgi:sterol desaturase/sphingolipid hydroxylase (fatty acid hydroxylase superfamily)